MAAMHLNAVEQEHLKAMRPDLDGAGKSETIKRYEEGLLTEEEIDEIQSLKCCGSDAAAAGGGRYATGGGGYDSEDGSDDTNDDGYGVAAGDAGGADAGLYTEVAENSSDDELATGSGGVFGGDADAGASAGAGAGAGTGEAAGAEAGTGTGSASAGAGAGDLDDPDNYERAIEQQLAQQEEEEAEGEARVERRAAWRSRGI
jgi:hypothetical protein